MGSRCDSGGIVVTWIRRPACVECPHSLTADHRSDCIALQPLRRRPFTTYIVGTNNDSSSFSWVEQMKTTNHLVSMVGGSFFPIIFMFIDLTLLMLRCYTKEK